jgi:hypothetical protein
MFYDVLFGQGWQRNIIIDGSPHLPANIRQWYGDSRGHWEGNTLVIDVTNFTPKTDFRGSRENLHLIERWTAGPTTLEYVVTIEDSTVWTRPWTVGRRSVERKDVFGASNELAAELIVGLSCDRQQGLEDGGIGDFADIDNGISAWADLTKQRTTGENHLSGAWSWWRG